MQQRSLKSVPVSAPVSGPGSEPIEDQPAAPTSIRPAPEDQLQKLAMLEGSARLRVAEQRVRHGLEDPAIRVQPSASTPLHTARHTRTSGNSYAPTAQGASKTSRWRIGLLVLAMLLLGAAAAVHWLR